MRRACALVAAALAMSAGATTAAPEGGVALDGYAEWADGRTLIVDGQRLRLAAGGRFRGEGAAQSADQVPLGYEVHAQGRRSEGVVLAEEIGAKPNGSAMFERQILAATDEAEADYRRAGAFFQESDGRRKTIGRLREEGPEVDRVRAAIDRMRPPYLDPGAVRAYVVENDEWNAFAMGNYSVYAFSGLLKDLDDDELAIVLGHELVHATHEHTRRQFKKQMWVQVAALGAAVAAGEIDDRNKRAFAQVLAGFTVLAWTNGYGRDLEDQADRVGLRYAYEGGYDVSRGPHLWRRFAQKYGEPGRVSSFFLANHSRASARAMNLERELALNYGPGAPAAHRLPTRGVTEGMSAEDVRRRLGPPDRQINFGGRMHWTYPGGSIVFERGKVSEVRF